MKAKLMLVLVFVVSSSVFAMGGKVDVKVSPVAFEVGVTDEVEVVTNSRSEMGVSC